jgi:hypothetical protein
MCSSYSSVRGHEQLLAISAYDKKGPDAGSHHLTLSLPDATGRAETERWSHRGKQMLFRAATEASAFGVSL